MESLTLRPRASLLDTPPDSHGALDWAELERLGIHPDEMIDFSENSSPYGPSPRVEAAVRRAAISRYPDRESLALRRALAARLGITPAQIVVGNGTAELLWLLAFAYIRPGDAALIAAPTFGEYARCVRLMGGHVEQVRAQAAGGFQVDESAFEEALHRIKPRMAFICNPNNPTGVITPPDVIGEWARQHSETLFVIDEAYIQFVPGLRSVVDLGAPNVLALRSMTKDYALAGLRLGYAAGPAALVEVLARARPPWNVNTVAQAAGRAALADEDHLQASVSKLQAAADALKADLCELGLSPVPSSTHYFILDVGDGADLRRRLLPHRVQVRDCASFGLPGYVRIAARRPDQNAKLIDALGKVLSA